MSQTIFTGFPLGFFRGGGRRNKFLGAPPLNFPGQTILEGGGQNFFKENEISHQSRN